MISISDAAFGAIGDGDPHPLSDKYATLAAARVDYPFVSALTQQIDWAAIQKAIWSVGTPALPRGTVVSVPRGVYLCSDDVRISRQIKFVGEGRGATELMFDAGTGIVVDSSLTSPDGGQATYGAIADLDVSGGRLALEQWKPGQPYQLQDRVCAPHDNRFYYECVRAGISRAVALAWAAGAYNAGDVVQPGTPLLFRCTEAGGDRLSGPDEPIWALPVDETTWDGQGALSHETVNYVLWQRVAAVPGVPPPAALGAWTPTTQYAVGQLVEATPVFMNGVFFRAQNAGNTAAEEPTWLADPPGELTLDREIVWIRYPFIAKFPVIDVPAWEPSSPYFGQTVVRARNFDPLSPVLFECTKNGTSGPGPGEPAWIAVPGAVTDDPPGPPGDFVQWTCRVDPSYFTDGGVVWACRVSPGIWLRTRCSVQGVGVSSFTSAGIHLQAQPLPSVNVNAWLLSNVGVYKCGLGVAVMGSDSQGGVALGLEIVANGYNPSGEILPRGNGGTAIYDRGNGPNVWVGCTTEGNTGRAYVSPTSNAVTTILGCYTEGDQQPSHLGYGAIAVNNIGRLSPNSDGWMVNSRDDVGAFTVRNRKNIQLRLYVGYESDDPTILMGWAQASEFWVVRWDEAQQIWRTGPAGDGQSPASYGTGGAHPRGTYLQGLPALLLGDPSLLAPPQGPIKISVSTVTPNWTGEPGDVVYNAAQANPADPAYEPYAGWICVGPLREWKRFGRIEP